MPETIQHWGPGPKLVAAVLWVAAMGILLLIAAASALVWGSIAGTFGAGLAIGGIASFAVALWTADEVKTTWVSK